mmetsp:Transcript_61627/g.146010  ORF Transcript_61627/g.146010 Transcript_61627/m.146010 type:complete len:328 (-) Transcript_61627:246-1229(-)
MQEKSPSMLLGLLLVAAPAASAFGFAAVGCSAVRGVGGGVQLRNGGCVAAGRVRPVALGGLSMERKNFDKSYDGAFDDFRTSGSMPDIPGLGERYSLEASYVRARGGDVKEAEGLEKRLTEGQLELEREQAQGLDGYEALKKDLLFDTFFLGAMLCCDCNLFFPRITTISLTLGSLGSWMYAFLLVRSADNMGSSTPSSGIDLGPPGRFAILVGLIAIFSKNKEALQIIPILIGFFTPYKIASLVPAFVSAPPLRPSELRVSRYWWQKPTDEPYEIQIGQQLKGVASRAGFTDRVSDTKTQSSAPLGQRKILSAEEQYKALQQGTID